MTETIAPVTLAERHQAFLQALAQKNRDGAMCQIEAIHAAPDRTKGSA